MIFEIPFENIDSLRKKIEKVNKKASLYNCSFIYKEIEEKDIKVETKVGDIFAPYVYKKVVIVKIEGIIKNGDWSVVGVIEHCNGFNVIHSMSSKCSLEKYRNAKSFCEHCGTLRKRNKTVIVYNSNTRELKQVGTTCLLDYTGIDLATIGYYESIVKECKDCENTVYKPEYYIEVALFLNSVVHCIKKYGWASKQMSYDSNGEVIPTSKRALEEYLNGSFYLEETQFTNMAINFIKNCQEDTEFMRNLKSMVSVKTIPVNKISYIACIPNIYNQHLESEKRKKALAEQAEKYEYFSSVDTKIRATGVLFKTASFDTQFGTMFIYKMIVDKYIFVWKTSKALEIDENGIKCQIEGKIKEHSEYKGIKQNILTRCKITNL